MELTKIEIENYKSIKSPVAITFSKDLPTVLIGKNGSGKTNVLEALSAIALANTNYYGNREKEQPIEPSMCGTSFTAEKKAYMIMQVG